MTVRQIIQTTIQQEGPISFERFMEMALYYPEKGYYSSSRNPIGTTGDYYTMPHLTPVFGAMIARQLKEMWEILGHPKQFMVVEIGAGNGQLCRSVMQYAGTDRNFNDALRYGIVERSITMCERARDIVPASVGFFQSVEEIPDFTGCVLSNELFDNIPFSVLVKKNELMEVFVDYDLDFFEVLRPVSPAVKRFTEELKSEIPVGSRIEVSPKTGEFIGQIASKLQTGFMLTIDYGHTAAEVQASGQPGTLTCYHQHQVNQNPYMHVGEQDITYSVNFSTLSYYGGLKGFSTAGYVCQANFLRTLGLLPFLAEWEDNTNPKTAAASRFVADLLLNKYGNKFKVLMQYKGVPHPFFTGLILGEAIRM
jgi:SAM-dependent MidA family methyltransferase